MKNMNTLRLLVARPRPVKRKVLSSRQVRQFTLERWLGVAWQVVWSVPGQSGQARRHVRLQLPMVLNAVFGHVMFGCHTQRLLNNVQATHAPWVYGITAGKEWSQVVPSAVGLCVCHRLGPKSRRCRFGSTVLELR